MTSPKVLQLFVVEISVFFPAGLGTCGNRECPPFAKNAKDGPSTPQYTTT
jgi:hypothetical protein